MAKRFVCTERFEDPWYRSLPPKAKLLWEYMLAACDCAGIWKADFGIASYVIGVPVKPEILKEFFDGRVKLLDNGCIFIPKFLMFQYEGMDLTNQKNGVVRGIHKRLASNGLNYPDCLKGDTLSDTPSDTLSKIGYGIGDRNRIRNNNIVNNNIYIDTFNTLWRQYPNKQGRKDALRHFTASVKTEDRIPLITQALENYLAHVAGKEPQFIKNGSTWFYQWEDWIENPVTDIVKERAVEKQQREVNAKLKSMGLA